MDRFGTERFLRLRQRFSYLVLATVLICLTAALAAAQDSRGSIGGRVSDSSGGVLPGSDRDHRQ